MAAVVQGAGTGGAVVRRALGAPELKVVADIIAQWRERLYDLSWLKAYFHVFCPSGRPGSVQKFSQHFCLRGVNETIARMANAEDNVKERFYRTHPCVLPCGPSFGRSKTFPMFLWGRRFKSQALLDETALLSCMAYVDLNPIRAGIENDVINSDFTSIQQRLFDYVARKPIKNNAEKTAVRRVNDQRKLNANMKLDKLPAAPLMPFDGSSHTDVHVALPFTREDYFDLVDATGRIMREDKKGFIPSEVPPVLLRFGIQPHKWLDHVKNFSRRYGHCAGSVARMQDYAAVFDKRWCKGVGVSQRLAS